MSRLILAFAVGISLLAPAAFAQEQNTTKRFITTQACDAVLKITDIVMNKYGESPLFKAKGLQFAAPQGQPFQSDMMYFVNQDSGTWSLIALYPDGTACMVANGKEFEPYSGPIGRKTVD
jgi:phage/plasmid primase-like uncharacterized protein